MIIELGDIKNTVLMTNDIKYMNQKVSFGLYILNIIFKDNSSLELEYNDKNILLKNRESIVNMYRR